MAVRRPDWPRAAPGPPPLPGLSVLVPLPATPVIGGSAHAAPPRARSPHRPRRDLRRRCYRLGPRPPPSLAGDRDSRPPPHPGTPPPSPRDRDPRPPWPKTLTPPSPHPGTGHRPGAVWPSRWSGQESPLSAPGKREKAVSPVRGAGALGPSSASSVLRGFRGNAEDSGCLPKPEHVPPTRPIL